MGQGQAALCSSPDHGAHPGASEPHPGASEPHPGASEPQRRFSCHTQWHCCRRSLGSCNSPHAFQSFGHLFLEGFPFLKLLCRYFVYFQPFLSYFSASRRAHLWAGKAASAWVGGCKLPCCPLVTISAKGLVKLKNRPNLRSSWYFIYLTISGVWIWINSRLLFVLFSFSSLLSFFYTSWLGSALNTWC